MNATRRITGGCCGRKPLLMYGGSRAYNYYRHQSYQTRIPSEYFFRNNLPLNCQYGIRYLIQGMSPNMVFNDDECRMSAINVLRKHDEVNPLVVLLVFGLSAVYLGISFLYDKYTNAKNPEAIVEINKALDETNLIATDNKTLKKSVKKSSKLGRNMRTAITMLLGVCLSENNGALANTIAPMTSIEEKRAEIKKCINEKYNAMNKNMFLDEKIIDKVLIKAEKDGVY